MNNYILITDIVEIRDDSIISGGAHWINPDKIVHLQVRSNKAFRPYTIVTLDNGEVIKTTGYPTDLLDAMGIAENRVQSQLDLDEEEDDDQVQCKEN